MREEEQAARHAQLKYAPVTQAQRDAAVLWVWGQAKRGLDVRDAEQHRAAIAIAKPVLEALGLLGAREDLRPTVMAKLTVARFTHGTRGAVEAHQAAGTGLCKPCHRWVEVESRKNGSAVVFQYPPSEPGRCGTYSGWQGHLTDKQLLDPACAMYAAWLASTKTVKPNGTGPLARHELPNIPLPVHLDGTVCGHQVTRAGYAMHAQCTGRAGWKQDCACGFEAFVATYAGANDIRVEHRRQVILHALAEEN